MRRQDYYEVLSKNMRKTIYKALAQLDPKEAIVIACRNGLGMYQEMTIEEIARLPELEGLSVDRVRMLENRAINKLRYSEIMNSIR